jgi:hypothetical protein
VFRVVGAVTLGVNISVKHHDELTLMSKNHFNKKMCQLFLPKVNLHNFVSMPHNVGLLC